MDLKRFNIVAITGAGLSAESGVPTYRGENGIYTKIQKEMGMPIEEIVHPHMAKHNPEVFWKYWWTIYQTIGSCKPNKSHELLKEISLGAKSFLEVTQNIDGYSLQCGIENNKVIELHGSAHHYYCIRCNMAADLPDDVRSGVPQCSRCIPTKKSILRPKVVMFTENIKSEKFKRAISAATRCDVMLIIGTELHFQYLEQIVMSARRNGAIIININPETFDDIKYLDYEYHISSKFDILNIQKTASQGLLEFIEMGTNNRLSHPLL